MPGPLLIASAGLSIAGGVLGAKSAAEQARDTAKLLLEQAGQEIVRIQEGTSEIVGEQVVGFAAGGVSVNSGSPMLVVAETFERSLRDQKAIKSMAERQARAARKAANAQGIVSVVSGAAGAGLALGS